MEDKFLYLSIKATRPDEFFHSADKYMLKWQPPGSLFKVMIPLDNPRVQENAVNIFATLTKKEQKNVLFFFTPIDPLLNMFAPKVHPSSLVSYRTKTEILKKLSDFFSEEKIAVDELQQILLCDMDSWRFSLYNLLPADEQVFHEYLNERTKAEDLNKSLAKKYIDGDINLQQYEDLKFPDRKKLKDIEASTYPLEFIGEACAICKTEGIGAVSCQSCSNQVCKMCMERIFIAPESPEEGCPFLMLHQKYCMKLGDVRMTAFPPIEEPIYLRQFRAFTRIAAVEKLTPKKVEEVIEEYDPSDDEEEMEIQRQRELVRRQWEQAEAERINRENPPALRELRSVLDDKIKRFEKLRKDILKYLEKINDPGHTDQFVARNERLKDEAVVKIQRHIKIPIIEIREKAADLSLEGEFIDSFNLDVKRLMLGIDNFCE